MKKLHAYSVARGVASSSFCIASALLVGCANLPADDAAVFKNPTPVLNLIYSGKIGPNDMLESKHFGPTTPLCAIVRYRQAAAAIDQLLKAGADVNKPCRTDGEQYYALDSLISGAVAQGTQKSPYVTRGSYNPEAVQFLMGRIEYLMSLGARTSHGDLTFAEVQAFVAKETGSMNEFVEQQKRIVAEQQKNSLFSAENLGIAVAVAGGVVNNYAAAKNSSTAATGLPLAIAKATTAGSTAQPKAAPTTSKEMQTRATAGATSAGSTAQSRAAAATTATLAAATQPPAPIYVSAGKPSAIATPAVASEKSVDGRDGDAEGCIDAIGWCSTPPAFEMKGRTARLRFKNTCPFRVYGNFYNGLADGRVDDGASGVAPGATHTWSSQDASGRSFIRVIGSTRSRNDWVCQGKKLSGFTAGDSTLERN